MQHFIELYDDTSGIMLAKVAGRDAAQATARALELLSSYEAAESPPKWVWFVDPKTGAAGRHAVPATATFSEAKAKAKK